MVRSKPMQKRKSTSIGGTPSQRTSKGKQLIKPQKNKIEKKKKKMPAEKMCVGTKIFTISRKILKEIKRYQLSTNNLIPKLPFARLVHEIMLAYVPQGRVQRLALEALQEASESYLVQYLEDSYICTLHARRSTLIPRDMEVVERLRRNN